jgi:hypothetical protein
VPTILSNLDLAKNQLLNALAHILASAPGSPVEGQFYYDSTSKVLSFRTASAWIVLGRLDQITAPTGPVAMNGQKLTGLADPGAAQDAATQAYVLARSLSNFAAPSADLAIGSHKLTGVTDPTGAQDAATKNYVDNAVNGLDWKSPVRVKSTGNIVLASGLTNGSVIDGVTVATGDRVLLASQTAPAENGIYPVVASGAATRALDADSPSELLQLAVGVEEGTLGADTFWVSTTNGPVVVGTTALAFAQFGAGATYTNGTGLALAGNIFSIENSGVLLLAHGGTGAATAPAARANLGAIGKFAADIGNGALTSIAVVHSLGSLDVGVQVVRKSDGVVVVPDITVTDANTVTLGFAVAPTSAQYRVTVVG